MAQISVATVIWPQGQAQPGAAQGGAYRGEFFNGDRVKSDWRSQPEPLPCRMDLKRNSAARVPDPAETCRNELMHHHVAREDASHRKPISGMYLVCSEML